MGETNVIVIINMNGRMKNINAGIEKYTYGNL